VSISSKSINTSGWGRPILRWAGSKRKLLPLLTQNIPQRFETYIEPFCGSACLFFAINPANAILADINKELINAYRVLKRSPSKLAQATASISPDKETYHEMRARQPHDLSTFERAVRFIYLNRYCFNGVYRTNRKGQFNVPMGIKVGALPDVEQFRECHTSLKSAKLISSDFSEVLDAARPNDFIYLDPPYSNSTQRNRGEYGADSFTYLDIDRLIKKLKEVDERGTKFLLSYSATDEVIKLLPRRWQIAEINVKRHVAGFGSQRVLVREILVKNDTKIIGVKSAKMGESYL